VAFVAHANRLGRFRFRHPEGWAQTTVAAAAGPAPSVADARTRLVPTLDVPGAAFQLESVQTASLPAGAAVRVGWRRNSAPDAVTGRVYRDEVVTYLVGAGGTVVRMDLSGPVGADNVGPVAHRVKPRGLAGPHAGQLVAGSGDVTARAGSAPGAGRAAASTDR